MVKAVFDTNILIDYLNGITAAQDEILRYRERAVSIVTWMEVMVGTTPETEAGTHAFLGTFEILLLTDLVAEEAVALRRTHRIRLPDAVIWASALTSASLLVTRNSRDFPADRPEVRIPYVL